MKMLAKNLKSFDDVVFENRNKSYGAYAIRKSYNNTMLKSLVGCALLLIAFLFLATRTAEAAPVVIEKRDTVKLTDVKIPEPEVAKPIEKPIDQPIKKPVESEVKPNLSSNGQTALVDKKVDPNKQAGPIDQDGEKKPLDTAKVVPSKGVDTTGLFALNNPPPRHIAQVMPAFPGGEAAMMKFISNQAKRNNTWVDMGLTGTVYVQFIVQSDGSISNVEAVRGPYEVLKKVAIGSVKAMPHWNPGMQDGRAVPVILVVPISFKQ